MIVPSGKRKLMKLQQSAQVIDHDPQAEQIEYTAEGGDGPAMDFNALQQGMQGGEAPEVPSEEDLHGAVDQGLQFPGQGAEVGVSEGDDGLGQEGNNIRDVVFKTLEEMGIPGRFIMSNGDKLFGGEKDLSTGQLKGHFMIPTYTEGSKISQDEAEKIAAHIGSQFGLQMKISHEKNNFRVSYQTQDLKPEGIGSSLDELVGGNSGNAENFQRAASTQREMIKTSRQGLIDTLLEIGENK